jgi:hypothetical protein
MTAMLEELTNLASWAIDDLFNLRGFFVAFGFLFVCLGFYSALMNARARTWPVAEGKILSSEVREREDSDGDTVYSAAVHYQYIVDGQMYESRNISYATHQGGWDSASRAVERYPRDMGVLVHYNPRAPKQAALEVPKSKGWVVFVAVGSLFVAVGLLWLGE